MPHQSNLLFLVHRVPFPPNRGDRIRSYQILKRAAETHRVHLATLADEHLGDGVLEELESLCERVCVLPVGGGFRWWRAAATLTKGKTLTEGLFWSPRLAQVLRNWAAQTHFDVIVVYCSSMMQYVAQTVALHGVPTIVDLVDVDSQKFLDYADSSRGLKRLVLRLEANRLRAVESALPKVAHAIMLTTEQEAAVYRGFCPNDRTHAVANGVDMDFFHDEISPDEAQAKTCVFVGALDYWPNIDGLNWFCQHVWPEVTRRHPEAKFSIVGRRPRRSVESLNQLSGVDVVGEVDDVRPYLRTAAIAVVPLNIARGIQNKVLEAMSMGKAVLASPQAIEGLGVCHGQEVLCADSADSWIAQILSLFEDESLRRDLGHSARKFVERFHSWQACLSPFEELLKLAGAAHAGHLTA